MKILFIAIVLAILTSCSAVSEAPEASVAPLDTRRGQTENTPEITAGAAEKEIEPESELDRGESLIDTTGRTVAERFRPPEGFKRTEEETGSFGDYLRKLPLKPHGSKVKYYDGRTKSGGSYLAVLDMDTGERDLQQCADSVIRLRAEYLYGKKLYESIHFNFTSGFRADYTRWMKGYRIVLRDSNAVWMKKAEYSGSYESFRSYLEIVYAYAGTLSLSKELRSVPLEDLKAGDIFIKGGSPGHAVIAVDTAVNSKGEKLFMLAQGYMPAQDMHILENLNSADLGPWFGSDFGDTLETPDWSFGRDCLMRFRE